MRPVRAPVLRRGVELRHLVRDGGRPVQPRAVLCRHLCQLVGLVYLVLEVAYLRVRTRERGVARLQVLPRGQRGGFALLFQRSRHLSGDGRHLFCRRPHNPQGVGGVGDVILCRVHLLLKSRQRAEAILQRGDDAFNVRLLVAAGELLRIGRRDAHALQAFDERLKLFFCRLGLGFHVRNGVLQLRGGVFNLLGCGNSLEERLNPFHAGAVHRVLVGQAAEVNHLEGFQHLTFKGGGELFAQPLNIRRLALPVLRHGHSVQGVQRGFVLFAQRVADAGQGIRVGIAGADRRGNQAFQVGGGLLGGFFAHAVTVAGLHKVALSGGLLVPIPRVLGVMPCGFRLSGAHALVKVSRGTDPQAGFIIPAAEKAVHGRTKEGAACAAQQRAEAGGKPQPPAERIPAIGGGKRGIGGSAGQRTRAGTCHAAKG